MEIRKPELLLPAGSMDVFRTVLDYGADAVYIGGEAFSPPFLCTFSKLEKTY